MLGLFFDIFGCCFRISSENRLRNDFWSIFEPLDLQKRYKNKWFLKIFAFTSWSLLRPILDRFWLHFASPNRPKIGPETVQTSIKFPCRFCAPSRTSKNRFDGQHGPNMAPTWLPRWAQVGSKMASEPNQKRPRKRRWSLNWFWTDFGPIWDRFWIDLGSILIQFSQVFQFMHSNNTFLDSARNEISL